MNTVASESPAQGRLAPTPNLPRAFGGVWRLSLGRYFSLPHWLAVAGLLVLLGILGYAVLDGRHGTDHYLGWVVGFYVTFLVPVMAFLNGAGAIRDDMKASTVDYVLTRPVPRPAFVGFRFLSQLVAAQLDLLLSFVLVVVLGMVFHAPGVLNAAPLLLLAQVGLVTAFTAFGFACGVMTAKYVVVGILYGAVIEIGVGQIPTELNRVSMTHQVKSMLQPLVAGANSGFTNGIETLSPSGRFSTLATLLAFTVVTLGIAAAIFTWRELNERNEA